MIDYLCDFLLALGVPTPGASLVADAGGEELIGREASARLGLLLRKAAASEKEKFFTVESLLRKVRPSSTETFLHLLEVLVERGILRRIIRVESPRTKAGLLDVTNYKALPPEIEDNTTGEIIPVVPEDLRILFQAVRDH